VSTVTVVRKHGYVAIACDTLTKWGTGMEPAGYIVNHDKILRVGDSLVAVTGAVTFRHALEEFFGAPDAPTRLHTPMEIFRAWQELHVALKERYFLLPEEDKDEGLESSRMDVLIANPSGIFGVSAHRTVQEFSKFYAYGSGADYALGALYTIYDTPDRSAEELARFGVQAAAEFDDGTGLPIISYTVPLEAGKRAT
jgi:ATP-dependent HslUV protease subunit HslV